MHARVAFADTVENAQNKPFKMSKSGPARILLEPDGNTVFLFQRIDIMLMLLLLHYVKTIYI